MPTGIEVKAILNVCGVNLKDIDEIKEQQVIKGCKAYQAASFFTI